MQTKTKKTTDGGGEGAATRTHDAVYPRTFSLQRRFDRHGPAELTSSTVVPAWRDTTAIKFSFMVRKE